MDYAHEETEKMIKALEKRLAKEYKQAEKEAQAKLNDYLRRFATKDAIWQKWVQEGTKTEAEYKKWRLGQMCMGQRWQELRDSLAKDFVNVDKIARSIINGYTPAAYALNHNYGTYQVEKGSHIDTSYTLYDRQTVERMFREDPEMLPPPGYKVSQKIREGKAERWNKQVIQSVATQAVLSGESIPDIATRLARSVADSDRKAAIRNARTMMTGAENAGRVDSYKRAENMGIDMMQQWVATLDSRTRHSHRMLDGEKVEVGGVFSNGCRFPADPLGAAGEVYNCRCGMKPIIKGFEPDVSDMTQRWNKLGNMTYEEWKRGHGKSEDILKQEKISKAMKARAIREYREGR